MEASLGSILGSISQVLTISSPSIQRWENRRQDNSSLTSSTMMMMMSSSSTHLFCIYIVLWYSSVFCSYLQKWRYLEAIKVKKFLAVVGDGGDMTVTRRLVTRLRPHGRTAVENHTARGEGSARGQKIKIRTILETSGILKRHVELNVSSHIFHLRCVGSYF